MKNKTANNFLLVLTAFIWGSAFVAQSVGMDYLGPFTFNSIRCFLGGIVLLPVIYFRDKKDKKEKLHTDRRMLITGGLCCGIALAAGSSLQQIGLIYTSAGKAGFITALYILIVPILRLLAGKKAGIKIWAGVVTAILGMYFLCITDGFSLSKGDFLILICAVAFSVHILVIDRFAPYTDGIKLSCMQFFVCGIICAVPMFILEQPDIHAIGNTWFPLAYAGVLSCGAAYTLQIIAQKNTDPTVASLILSLESVFSVITGWIILGEHLSPRETLGCILVFAAVILAQLPSDSFLRKRKIRE